LTAARAWVARRFTPGRLVFLGIAAVAIFLAPQVLPNFYLSLLAKYVCFAIVAIGIDLTWGYGGMLALGQGVFFGLGGYAVGLFLKLQEAGPNKVPDFMSWSGVDALPRFYHCALDGWRCRRRFSCLLCSGPCWARSSSARRCGERISRSSRKRWRRHS
jgi:urea transport system permease protein